MNQNIAEYKARSGRFEPVWTLEILTLPEDIDRILDAITAVHPLRYGRYERRASISAPGLETAQPREGSAAADHISDFEPGTTETYATVELKFSIERNLTTLSEVMEAVLDAHHYEEPMVFVREDWVSRSFYNTATDNPNRWWNNGRGLRARVRDIGTYLGDRM